MNLVEWSTVVGVVIALCGSVVIPLWLNKKNRDADASVSTVVSWRGITDALQEERNELRRQLREIDDRQRHQLTEIEATWEQRLTVARQRITELETEVAALRRALRDGLTA